MCIIMDVKEGNVDEKTLVSQRERLIRRCSSCWNLNLPIPAVGIWFLMVKLPEARSEREIGLFITTRIEQFEEK